MKMHSTTHAHHHRIARAKTKVRSVGGALMLLLGGAFLFSCSSDGDNKNAETKKVSGLAHEAEVEDDGKGIGPVKTVSLTDNIDEQLALTGKEVFESKCSACHQLSSEKVVGPGLAGVTERRKPEWVMNMMLNPEEMTKKDPVAKKMLAEHLIQMTNQNVNEQDARAMLEYFRKNDAQN